MIKFIKKLFKKWCGIEEEMDPHAELYLKDKESDTPIYENEKEIVGETAKQKKIRLKHKGK